MKRLGLQYLQLGGFLEMPLLEDVFFSGSVKSPERAFH
jgi:hypothetical protein